MTATCRVTPWFPRLVVLATGIAIGFFVWRTYVDSVPHLYPLEFTQGQWLVAADGGPQGYLRKELYIPAPIRQAWVSVAATDSFILYVNGKAVDAKAYASLNVSGMYDIGPYLQVGKNVVGVLVRRRSYPGAAMAVAEGAYVDESGRQHAFATDASWKSSATEQRQGAGDILWHSDLFDDVSWLPARTAGQPRPSEVYPLAVHPLALTKLPQGRWIGHPYPLPSQATFSQTLRLSGRPEDAWLRIAAAGPYTLMINGVTVTGEEASSDFSATRSALLHGDPVWSNSAGASTDVYRIVPLLRSGTNRLTVTTEGRFAAFPGLFVDGFLIHHGEVLAFGSDAAWLYPSSFQMINGQHLAQSGTTLLADRDLAGAPLPIKKPRKAVLPVSHAVKRGGRLVLVVSITGFLTFIMWRGMSRLLHGLQGRVVAECSQAAALMYLPTLVLLGGLLLLSFDVRFDPALPYQGWVSYLVAATLVLPNAAMILEARSRQQGHVALASLSIAETYPLAKALGMIVLSGLTMVGAFLRLQGLDTQSLYHDEVHMVSFVKGLLERGYPYKRIGSIEIPLSTYELVPYPIALSTALLGFNDFALRLPAALFGIMTIPLIYVIGTQVFNPRVGLLAAAIYTFCPQAIVWAKYLWHPQQVQFFALLTSYLFYRAIRPVPMSPTYLYLAAVGFIVTYLSWEGAGFLLPALAIGLLLVKGRDLSWRRNKHLWLAGASVVVVITLQLVRRILLQVPYLVVGTGLSDVSLPRPVFLEPMYDPIFYIKNLLWLENNVILTLLLMGGLPFLYRHAGLSYYAGLFLAIPLMMTNLLPRATIRYVYYIQTYLILSSSAVAFFLHDYIVNSAFEGAPRVLYILKKSFILMSVAIIICGSSIYMQLFRLNNFSYPTGIHTRPNSYYIDYRSAAHHIKSQYIPGDLIIVVMPEVIHHYSNIEIDYFLEDYAKRQVFYDPVIDYHRYLERTSGIPSIRMIQELYDVLSHNRRTWIIATPYSGFEFLSGPDVVAHIRKHATITYESYDASVFLLKN